MCCCFNCSCISFPFRCSTTRWDLPQNSLYHLNAPTRSGMPCVCRVAREDFPDAQSCCSPPTRHTQGMPLRVRKGRPQVYGKTDSKSQSDRTRKTKQSSIYVEACASKGK